VGEQRYKAVMAVLGGGRTVTEVARDWEVSRQTLHAWLTRYEREGMEGMGDRSRQPRAVRASHPRDRRRSRSITLSTSHSPAMSKPGIGVTRQPWCDCFWQLPTKASGGPLAIACKQDV
jgi:transposase-like protein